MPDENHPSVSLGGLQSRWEMSADQLSIYTFGYINEGPLLGLVEPQFPAFFS